MRTPEQTQRLRDLADYMDANPETVDMSNWCGTRQCAAGHAVCLFGQGPEVDALRAVIASRETNDDTFMVAEFNIADYAQELLGLTSQERDNLFYSPFGLPVVTNHIRNLAAHPEGYDSRQEVYS